MRDIFNLIFITIFTFIRIREPRHKTMRIEELVNGLKKKLFPIFPYLKWRCFPGLENNFSFALKTEIYFICFTHFSSDDHNFEKKEKKKQM